MNLLRYLKKFFGQATSGRQSPRGRVRLAVEALESRFMPSVTLSNTGHLVVKATGTHDQINVGINNAGGILVTLNVNAASFSYRPGQVSSIEVDTPSTDTSYVYVPYTLASVPLTINSFGHGDISLGDGYGYLDDLLGPVTVNGNGLTTVTLNDNAGTLADPYTITSSTVSRPDFGGLTYADLASLYIQGSSATPTTANFDSTMLGTQYYWNSHISGALPTPSILPSDQFNLGTGNLDALQGHIFIAQDDPKVFLDDHANPATQSYVVDDVTDPASYEYGSTISVQRGGCYVQFTIGDDYPLSAAVVPYYLTIDGGTGKDICDFMPNAQRLDQIRGLSLSFHGGGGSNSLIVNGQQDPTGKYGYGLGNGLWYVGDDVVDYTGVQSLVFNGPNSANYNVQSVPNGGALTLNVGSGSNDVWLETAAMQGDLTVAGTANGSTTVAINDQSDAVGRDYVIDNGQVSLGQGGQIDLSNVQDLVLNGGNGGNNFVLLSTPASMTTTINAGTHDDAVQAGGTVFGFNASSLLGPVVINGQGNTTFTEFDQSATTAETYTLSGTSTGGEVLARSGGLVATCNNVPTLTIDGSSGGNAFEDLVPVTSRVTFHGGSGSSALSATEGVGHVTAWLINGPGSGQVGKLLYFTGIDDLVGTTTVDNFEFFTGGSIAGTIYGGGGSLGNILSYVNETGPVTVNMQTGAAPQIAGGALGGFSDITTVDGSTSSNNTLIGPDANTTWTINAANGGSAVAGSLAFEFSQFQNLVGGAGVDVFQFTAAGSLAGSLNGGSAPLHSGNWLDYSALTTPVSVNLQTGKATGVAGGVTNIQDVHGGSGTNTLTGDSQGNILIGGAGANVITGGTGASILIGDTGSSKITGGSGNDILIGAATIYDVMNAKDETALMGLLAEWQSADSYATRFHDINTGTGGGLNGTAELNFGISVLNDATGATLTAAASAKALNWFFQTSGDTLVNFQNGEHVNNT